MFLEWKETIEDGSVVVAYTHPTCAEFITVKAGETYRNRYGSFKHDSMIGVPYGSKISATADKGFVYLLHPSPELWTNYLNHRTQILYMPDISLISTFLNLRPGVSMLEAGTGSGSFSHSIARTVYPNGKLYSFEYHAERAAAAKKEFEEHGLSDIITIQHRNVCKEGFGLEDAVNAAFLDLPAPWDAIEHLIPAFKKDSVSFLCCYSPCIEQVQQTVGALQKHGLTEVKMFEVLIRPFDVKKASLNKWTRKPVPLVKKRKLAEEDREVGQESAETKEEDPELQLEMKLVARFGTTVRGHTSYLTFAKYVPPTSQ